MNLLGYPAPDMLYFWVGLTIALWGFIGLLIINAKENKKRNNRWEK